VLLMAVVSNTGYVCDAQIIRGLDKDTDKKAVQAVRSWRFQPGQKDGHPVPTVITVQVTYRKDGELVQPIITPSQDELQH
jgi:TonB family protein